MHILVLVLVAVIILCFGYIFYLRIFKKYTRERFAFVGLTAILALVTTFIIQIYSSQGVITAIVHTSQIHLNANLKSYQTDYKDHIICLIVIGFLINWIYKIHQNWTGPISSIHAEKKRFREENNIYIESLIQAQDFFRSIKKIIPYSEIKNQAKYQAFSSVELDKTPWYEDVYELFIFKSNHYLIDINNDFYKEERCFIGKYGPNKEPIAILCSVDEPDAFRIKKFLEFIHSQHESYYKIFVAIKNINQDKIEREILGHKIEFRYHSEMLDSLIDFFYYKEFIRDQYESKEITFGSKITLKDFYVPLNGSIQDEKKILEVESYILDWSLSSNDLNKHLAVLGEYGCGKSVLSLKIVYEMLNRPIEASRIPILIELRGKSPRNLSTLEILSTWASAYRIEPLALWKLHRAGRLMIIFEGFDEMDMVGDRDVRFSHFQRLWEFAIPNSKLIITGRPNFFLDDHELKINLGIEKPFETSHFCEAVYLEKLNSDQIKSALRKVDHETSSQVIQMIKQQNNSNFYDLVSRPAILYLVSVIWKDRKLSLLRNKINSANVIGEFIQYSYSRQTDKNITFPLTEHEREYFMLGIAAGMLKFTELSNQINKTDLETIIIKLFRNFPEELTPVKNATQANRGNLIQRLQDNTSAEEMILTDVRSCGILVNDLSRKDYFKFAHKSFFEYLVSLFFAESLINRRDAYFTTVKAISGALETNLSQFGHSKETITFTAEILANKLSLGSDVNSEENKQVLCEKLFETIYPIKALSRYPKIASFFEILYGSRNMSFLISFPLTFGAAALIFFKIDPGFAAVDTQTKSYFRLFVLSLGLLPSLLYLLLRFVSRSIGRQRAIIWLNCCHQLNINEDVMAKVTSKHYISYVKGNYEDLAIKIVKKLAQIISKT